MTILDRLWSAVENETAASVLDTMAKAIADEMPADACCVFLHDDAGRRHIAASFGHAGLSAELKLAMEKRAEQAESGSLELSSAAPLPSVLAAPVLSRGKTIGAVAVCKLTEPAFAVQQKKTLLAIAAQIVTVIESAHFVEVAAHPGAERVQWKRSPPVPSTAELILQGSPAAPGIAIGQAVFRRAFPRQLAQREVVSRGEQEELQRARDAFMKARNDIAKIQTAARLDLGEEHALIFTSHLLLLSDHSLHGCIEERIAAGMTAAAAVEAAVDQFESRLRGAHDPYIRERVEDLEDLCSRLLGYIINSQNHAPIGAHVVVSPRVAPSLVMELRARRAHGIVAESGGTTSHGVLLARSLGIPAITGVPDLMNRVLDGDALILDGDTGQLFVRPTADTLAHYSARRSAQEQRRTQFAMYRGRPCQSADGIQIKLQANVALGVDMALARDNGAIGIGLYRTEFPFMLREGFPTVEEQVEIYRKAYECFPDGPINFRILDLAGDKLVPTSSVGAALNAFHGYRSIRVLFDYPHVLRDQIQAFAIAAGDRALNILVPMVSSLEDLSRIKHLVAEALQTLDSECAQRKPQFGAMIEMPAAVEIAPELAQEVDFLSIGTNDLIQYSLIIDREDARMTSASDAYHPAILRMIRRVVVAAHGAGKPVGVCGEMAARPELAAALIALGVDSLSVAPPAIPELKQAFSNFCLKPLTARAAEVLAGRDAHETERTIRQHLRPARD